MPEQSSSASAFIVDAVRTAGGRCNGCISRWHPADLGAEVVNTLLMRNKVTGSLVDDVIFGCVSQIGAQAGNVGRNIVLSSILPESVPGTTVDRACGSSQQALHFAAQAVMSGTQDIVIAGGVEIMSLVPIGSARDVRQAAGRGNASGKEMQARYPDKFSQFDGAESLALEFNISKEEMEEFAVNSHRKAHEATASGRFRNEIIPIAGYDKKSNQNIEHERDEGIRWPIDIAKLKSLPTITPKEDLLLPLLLRYVMEHQQY